MRRSLFLLLLFCPACSLWAVRGPDRSVPGGGDCTTSPAAPVIDGVLGGGLLALGAAAASSSKGGGGDWGSVGAGMAQGASAGAIILGVAQAAVATYGGIQVAACREAKTKLAIPASQLRPAPAWGKAPDTSLAARAPGSSREEALR